MKRKPVPPQFRNNGSSFGLEHPFIYGKRGKDWQVWDRHAGEIAFVSAPDLSLENLDTREYLAEKAASDECERLNCRHAGIPGDKLPVDIAAIDATPSIGGRGGTRTHG